MILIESPWRYNAYNFSETGSTWIGTLLSGDVSSKEKGGYDYVPNVQSYHDFDRVSLAVQCL